MSITDEISRLAALAAQRDPSWSAPPGASDETLARLREALEPLAVPADVEELYRWHDGFDLALFGGYGLQSIDALLADRPFEVDQLGYAPAWIVLSTSPTGTGIRYFVAAEETDSTPLKSIWGTETHDMTMQRAYNSLSAALETLSDMVEESPATMSLEEVGRGWPWDLPRSEDEYRLGRSPGAFEWPRVPRGTLLYNWRDPSWPDIWLRSMNVTRAQLFAEDPNFSPGRLRAQLGLEPEDE